MFYNYSDEELRAHCRNSLESFEMWARRIVHEKMVETYGEQYINYQKSDGNYLIKKEIRDQVQSLSQKEPQRISRPVDALFLDHLIYFLCNQEWYKELFKEALDFGYPQGRDEVRTFLERLIPIRNALSHSNPISARQAEQAICYSNDFIDGLKCYYQEKGLEKMWNVPRIIRVTDSLGNVFEKPDEELCLRVRQPLYCGDTYSVSIEVDASFAPCDYDIVWGNAGKTVDGFQNATKFVIKFTEKDIDEIHAIECKVISHKSWHRRGIYDSRISVHLTVLPPIE